MFTYLYLEHKKKRKHLIYYFIKWVTIITNPFIIFFSIIYDKLKIFNLIPM